jgi:paraquat-inducible protein B
LIWIVPALAIAIGGWIGLKDLVNRGPQITIDFTDASGIEANKSVLEFRGVTIGKVADVKLRRDLGGATVSVRLNKSAAVFAKGGSEFWIVQPEIGFSGVRGLDTLLTGSRLNVRPGDGPPTRKFVGLDAPPPPEISVPGRTFVLRCGKLGSLTAGAPVYYREFKVGEVEASRLADDSATVLIRIHVDPPYIGLVRTNTKFWNAGGFSFKINLLGAQIKDTSLESLITGGVAFATPDSPLADPAPEETVFDLYSEPDAEWSKWSPKIPLNSPENSSKPPRLGGGLPSLIKP